MTSNYVQPLDVLIKPSEFLMDILARWEADYNPTSAASNSEPTSSKFSLFRKKKGEVTVAKGLTGQVGKE